jgi:hypothetical protein
VPPAHLELKRLARKRDRRADVLQALSLGLARGEQRELGLGAQKLGLLREAVRRRGVQHRGQAQSGEALGIAPEMEATAAPPLAYVPPSRDLIL